MALHFTRGPVKYKISSESVFKVLLVIWGKNHFSLVQLTVTLSYSALVSCTEELQRSRAAGRKTLVHCNAGVRSQLRVPRGRGHFLL